MKLIDKYLPVFRFIERHRQAKAAHVPDSARALKLLLYYQVTMQVN
jgi:hypothetical protein